jgi:putative SOS response-associated peptidase YedK
MCGRIVCYSPLDEISAALHATLDPSASAVYQPSYNIPPSQPLPIACQFEGDHRLLMAKWGLLPHWAKDESLAFKTFNARAETVREKPSFRGAFKYRRCLIPVNGYYEWQRSGSSKLPYYFTQANDNILVLAGLYELWKEELLTCTVITTHANEKAREVHDRMPVILEEDDWQTWVEGSPDDAYHLLRPAPDGWLNQYRVDVVANNVRNDGASLIAPL